MSTTLAYACDKCGSACAPEKFACHEVVVCGFCDQWYWFAPWSYQEVLGAIALERMYQNACEQLRAQRTIPPPREVWIKIPSMEFLEPSMVVLALQASVLFSTERFVRQLQHQATAETLRRQLILKRN